MKSTMMTKIWLVPLLVFAPHLCSAQGNETVVVSLRANSLSGIVVDQAADPFPKIAVYRIECGKGALNPVIILQQVQTDANGSFAFPWKDHNRTCLQVQTPNYNTLQVEVKYARSGAKLKLVLQVGK
jgi:hypothetical protein